ncbi:hypothetical protein MEQU1_000792 [Malassezia equina]|uniref:Uncharacterized protein n=1 Tax=Malassezia equina TaxID=1381935 RepID=A0AAF0ECQ4_9BASI|nr:hypothetical protein MEQU1_000792 [Malassezia equina]
MTPSQPPSVAAAMENHTPTPKRRKARGPHTVDSSFAHAMDLRLPAWQTIVAFRTSFGKGFNRVLDGTFNLSTARKVVCDKYQVHPQTPMSLSYTAPDGMDIDLEDAEDFRAFQVYASRESVVTVNVDLDEASVGTYKPATDGSVQTPSKPRARRGTRGKGSYAAPQAPEPTGAAAAPTATDAPAADAIEAPASTDATPKESGRKSKQKKLAEKDTDKDQGKKQKDNEPPQEAPAPVAAPPTADSDDDSDEDLPLSQSAPPSSQTLPPLSQESVTEKPRRHRRTKAEMEVFRAEQAAKKLEKEQARQNKASRTTAAADTTTDPAAAADETTIINEHRNEEYASAASSAVQALVEEGSAAMQQRLNDLKAKKQRKNAAEREEQKLLMGLIAKETSANDAMRENGLDTSRQDESTSFDSAEPFFSQPESHMPMSPSHIHGPSPRPSAPSESTPKRASTQYMDASDQPSQDASSRRPSSGFTKLSELRPSALRRTLSRQESPIVSASASEASADIEAMLGPVTSAADSDASSDTESSASSDSDSSEEDTAPALPASKMAGATAAASAEEENRAKRKRTFFSALS